MSRKKKFLTTLGKTQNLSEIWKIAKEIYSFETGKDVQNVSYIMVPDQISFCQLNFLFGKKDKNWLMQVPIINVHKSELSIEELNTLKKIRENPIIFINRNEIENLLEEEPKYLKSIGLKDEKEIDLSLKAVIFFHFIHELYHLEYPSLSEYEVDMKADELIRKLTKAITWFDTKRIKKWRHSRVS